MPRRLLISALAPVLLFAVRASSSAQSTDNPGLVAGPVLSKFSPPTYPPLAKAARVLGDVALTLRVRRDGSIESVVAESGPAMLKPAAVDSAQHSEFDCSRCTDQVTSYTLVYTFKLTHKTCCSAVGTSGQDSEETAGVTTSEGHVVVIADALCICDPAADVRRVRSVRCLYLWRCSTRWNLASPRTYVHQCCNVGSHSLPQPDPTFHPL